MAILPTPAPRGAAGAPPKPTSLKKLQLSRPIATHAGMTSTLEFRQATARQLIHFGQPFTLRVTKTGPDGEPTELATDFLHDRMILWVEDLTGVGAEELEQMHPSDWLTVCKFVRDMFAAGN